MFPSFTIYSIPLLTLYIWGVLICVGLLMRYYQKRNVTDLVLALIIIIHTFDRTAYTVGFLGWYDSFPNTKINYFLISLKFILGPLIYFYVKLVTQSNFKISKKLWLHALPQIVYILTRVLIYIYDVNQDGFNEVQNGKLFTALSMKYFGLIISVIADLSIAAYLFASIQQYFKFRKDVGEVYSSEQKSTLIWIRNFLSIFTFLLITMWILNEIDSSILQLNYKDYWWGHLAAALSLIYFGVYGYFLDITKFHDKNKKAGLTEIQQKSTSSDKFTSQIDTIKYKVENEKLYLDSDLTLASLAKKMNMKPQELSKNINQELKVNFNDFINQYRVEAVKDAIHSGRADKYTLLTIAYESGFNSKATFNRTFKKFTATSPSDYLKTAEK